MDTNKCKANAKNHKKKELMANRKGAANLTNIQTPRTCTVGTQTNVLKINTLENVVQPRKLARPTTAYIHQQKWPEFRTEYLVEGDKLTTRNKCCQTAKTGLKRIMSNVQMDNLKSQMLKRRKLSIDMDRARLQKLLDIINGDPPPPWAQASLMWLDVDKLEQRIEEFEKEEKEDQ